MDSQIRLVIEIKNRYPVELIDFATSMASIGGEYTKFIASGANAARPEDVKLFVKEVRTGSIITELVAIAPYAIPFIEHADTIVEYAKHLKTFYDWFSGRSKERPTTIDKTTLQNLSSIVEPVAKDSASQMNVGAVNIQGNLVMHFSLTSLEANAAQNGIRRELEAMREPSTGLHEQVVMYWAQARNNPEGTAGDKVRIESIFRGDVKVRFANDALKARMLYDEPFPFMKAYIVDVTVETIEGRPALFKVLKLHDVLPRDA